MPPVLLSGGPKPVRGTRMALSRFVGSDLISDVVVEAVRRQPWYAKNANTIVTAISALINVLQLVIVIGVVGNPQLAALIAGAITVLTPFAVKLTRNGVQESMIPRLASTAAVRRVAASASSEDEESARYLNGG